MVEISPFCFHVLAVDDCAVDRKIVAKILESAPFNVTTVDSGKKAMEVLGLKEDDTNPASVNDNKIDMILTDYCMPGMSGYDLLKMVKENKHLKSIPVVIMSSENEPQRISRLDFLRCLSEGAEDFILKPLQSRHVKKLRSYTREENRPPPPPMKASRKRKLRPDMMPENEPKRRPRFAGVAVS